MYVHEYLVHIGAPKTANSFLQEVGQLLKSFIVVQIRWDKGITVGEPPGFLHSWWRYAFQFYF